MLPPVPASTLNRTFVPLPPHKRVNLRLACSRSGLRITPAPTNAPANNAAEGTAANNAKASNAKTAAANERRQNNKPDFVGSNQGTQHLRRMHDRGTDRAARPADLGSFTGRSGPGGGRGFPVEAGAEPARYRGIAV